MINESVRVGDKWLVKFHGENALRECKAMQRAGDLIKLRYAVDSPIPIQLGQVMFDAWYIYDELIFFGLPVTEEGIDRVRDLVVCLREAKPTGDILETMLENIEICRDREGLTQHDLALIMGHEGVENWGRKLG